MIHIIQDGVVVNTIVATLTEAQAAYSDSVCIPATEGSIGWTWDGAKLTPPEPPPAPLPTVADFDVALTDHFDRLAHEQRWGRQLVDARLALIARAGYANPWQQTAIAFGTWMDDCNALAYQWLAEVQAGTRPLPASTQELIDALPPMQWPN